MGSWSAVWGSISFFTCYLVLLGYLFTSTSFLFFWVVELVVRDGGSSSLVDWFHWPDILFYLSSTSFLFFWVVRLMVRDGGSFLAGSH